MDTISLTKKIKIKPYQTYNFYDNDYEFILEKE